MCLLSCKQTYRKHKFFAGGVADGDIVVAVAVAAESGDRVVVVVV